jgi:signal transduction histidine kinase/ligand-binding sensor domain-containing protein
VTIVLPTPSHLCRTSCDLVLAILGLIVVLSQPARGLDPNKNLDQYAEQIWTTRDGLPADDVQSIIQTRDGYLWIGTEEGLARFDGVRFEIFNKLGGQLPGNYVYCLFEDSKGALWIGTDGGLVRYYDGTFETIGKHVGLLGALVTGMGEDREGTVWVSASLKLYRYQAGSFTCFDPLNDLKDCGGVVDVTVDRTGVVWVILKGDTIARFRDGHFEEVPELAHLKGQGFGRISSDSEGAIWLSNFSGGIYRYQNGRVTIFGQEQGVVPISHAARDRNGSVWVGVDVGLARISGEKCTTFHSDGKAHLGEFYTVYEDQEGNIWAGSNGKGLYRFTDGAFTSFRTEEGLPDGAAEGVCEDSDHNLWVAASDGIYRGRDHFARVLSARTQLGGNFVWVLLLADQLDHSVWIATLHGLFHYEYLTGRLTQYTVKDGLPSNKVIALCLDHQGTLWIGFADGLICLRDGRFGTPEVCQRLLAGKQVRCLAEDHTGAIWMGTVSGPMRYKDGEMTQFGQKDGLASVACRNIYVGSDGSIWVATWNGGLAFYTGNGFFTYSQKDGLPTDQISGIIDSPANGDLWLGSHEGVFRINESQLESFRAGRSKRIFGSSFGLTDGLKSLVINADGRPSVVRASDGMLWWSTEEGVAVVNPNDSLVHDKPGKTMIERVVADGQMVTDKNPKLFPGTRRLEVEYTSLTYAAADKVTFRYRLDGVDRDWFEAGRRREATFTNLRAGSYRFRVEASADGGATWNTPGAQLALQVAPFFYETWWFLSGCALLIIVLPWTVFALRRRRLEAHFRTVIGERVRVAGEIHDSLAQGFAGAAMLLDSLDHLIPPDSAVQLRLKSIRHILTTSLSDTRTMIATLRGHPAESQDLESAMRRFIDRFTSISIVPITLDFGQQKIPPLSAPVQQELIRICQEGINNAVRHANAQHIWISLRPDKDRHLRLIIGDNGQGFDVNTVVGSRDNSHFGLIGLFERAKRIGARLDIRSQPGHGTELELILPLRAQVTQAFRP